MRTEHVVVICRDSSGMPVAPVYKVEVTEDQYALGYHYDSAMSAAIEDGYEATMLSHCFDNSEHQELFDTVAFLRLKRKTEEIK